jgi:hypothetical protein
MPATRSSASRRARRAAVPLGAAAALVALLAAPALASTPEGTAGTGVTVQANGACTANSRTLSLSNSSGGGGNLNATTGSAGFETQVADGSGTCSDGFQVEATMSNLYQIHGSVWNCAASIPSSDVSFSAPTNPLDITGITASLDPSYQVTQGAVPSLGSAVNGVLTSLGISLVATPAAVTGLPLSNLTQSNLGLAAGELTNGALGDLPVNLAGGSSTASPFTSPDAPPTGSSCSGGSTATATEVPVLSGTANSALANAVDNFLGGAAGGSFSATTLLANSELDQGTLLGAVLPSSTVALLNLPSTNTALVAAGSSTTAVISALVASLSATVNPVLNVLGQGGTYAAAGKLAVNSSGATAGTYQGQLTLTLLDS